MEWKKKKMTISLMMTKKNRQFCKVFELVHKNCDIYVNREKENKNDCMNNTNKELKMKKNKKGMKK